MARQAGAKAGPDPGAQRRRRRRELEPGVRGAVALAATSAGDEPCR